MRNMIDEIQVQNLALIRSASLEPSSGLTVLTGETGAGKTALLSALKLLMGARASADWVRDGERELVVSGRFFNVGGEEEPCDETIVTRKVNAEGRSRASVNGSMASAGELAQLVASSIDLCGQFEHQQLMRPATHVSLLDDWAVGDVADALAAYRQAFQTANAAAAEYARLEEAQGQAGAKQEDARFTLARIDEVDPQEGEYEQLEHDLHLAEHAETLVMAAAGAHAALSDDGGAIDGLNAAASALEAGGRFDKELASLADSLREVGYVLEDVSAQARDYRDKIDFDPAELAAQQDRFSSMQGLLRAYGPRMEDVFARRAEAAEIIAMTSDAESLLRRARAACDEAEAALAVAADKLDEARENAAPLFTSQVTDVMARLQMQGGALSYDHERLPRESWSDRGPSSFEFLYKPTDTAHPRPLARIASGGEMSRVMLAVKVVLGNHDSVQTLVFDEVDAGVGGAVAVALADEIARLAQSHQVMVVTHLAQVAVRADTHYVVRREGNETALVRVEGDERELEIARMLSGSATEASLAHARELLADAQ